jgi:hypothetical protein
MFFFWLLLMIFFYLYKLLLIYLIKYMNKLTLNFLYKIHIKIIYMLRVFFTKNYDPLLNVIEASSAKLKGNGIVVLVST